MNDGDVIAGLTGEAGTNLAVCLAAKELIEEITVAEGAPAAGKRLSSVSFPTGALVVPTRGSDQIAQPDMKLELGERFIVAVEPGVTDEVLNLLRG